MSLAAAPHTDLERDVTRLIYRASLLLDDKDFKGWLDLCASDFSYKIEAYSFEIRKDMTWLYHDMHGMSNLVKMLPRHNTDQSNFTRHTTVYSVDGAQDGTTEAVSAVTVYRTALDGGHTAIFAVGKYYDTLTHEAGSLKFLRRRVRLDTRALGIGTHYPL